MAQENLSELMYSAATTEQLREDFRKLTSNDPFWEGIKAVEAVALKAYKLRNKRK